MILVINSDTVINVMPNPEFTLLTDRGAIFKMEDNEQKSKIYFIVEIEGKSFNVVYNTILGQPKGDKVCDMFDYLLHKMIDSNIIPSMEESYDTMRCWLEMMHVFMNAIKRINWDDYKKTSLDWSIDLLEEI